MGRSEVGMASERQVPGAIKSRRNCPLDWICLIRPPRVSIGHHSSEAFLMVNLMWWLGHFWIGKRREPEWFSVTRYFFH
jgi:hypothetical protein